MRARVLVAALLVTAGLGPVAGSAAAKCPAVPSPQAVSEAPPPADLAAQLAVLRRPQTEEADRATIDAFKNYGLRVLYAQSLRLLRTDPDGTSWYLFAGKSRAVRYGADCLRRMPPGLRRSMRQTQRRSAREARQVRVGVFEFAGSESGGAFGWNHRGLARGFATITVHRAGARRDLSGLVPDGVANVEVLFRDGSRLTAPVVDNLWTVPYTMTSLSSVPRRRIWKAADGTTLASLGGDGRLP